MKVTLNNPPLIKEPALKEPTEKETLNNQHEEKAVLKKAASNLAKESPNEILRDIAKRVLKDGEFLPHENAINPTYPQYGWSRSWSRG